MVDLHCHILFGLDDGPKLLDDSLAMAEDAIADGITHVVATPHCSSQFLFDFANVQAKRDELAEKLQGRLKLATGCDFHLDHENLLAIRKHSEPFCINQKDYLLVEFNEFSIPPAVDQTLHELQLAGLRPVITHPERNPNSQITARPVNAMGSPRLFCSDYRRLAIGSVRPGRKRGCLELDDSRTDSFRFQRRA